MRGYSPRLDLPPESLAFKEAEESLPASLIALRAEVSWQTVAHYLWTPVKTADVEGISPRLGPLTVRVAEECESATVFPTWGQVRNTPGC